MNMNSLADDSHRTAGTPSTIRVGGVDLPFAWCPPGIFQMGDGRPDAPRHRVRLSSGFWISTLAVPQSMWKEIMGKRFRSVESEPADLPVDGVSWDSAIAFCRALTQRLHKNAQIPPGFFCALPTEAQWEYACRAGTTTRWYFGDDDAELAEHAWFDENSGDRVHPVGQKRPNPWGIHDVYGNVAEWCLDQYANYDPDETGDPVGFIDSRLRVARGGSYVDPSEACDSAARRALLHDNPFTEETGIRVVINVTDAWIQHEYLRDLGLARP